MFCLGPVLRFLVWPRIICWGARLFCHPLYKVCGKRDHHGWSEDRIHSKYIRLVPTIKGSGSLLGMCFPKVYFLQTADQRNRTNRKHYPRIIGFIDFTMWSTISRCTIDATTATMHLTCARFVLEGLSIHIEWEHTEKLKFPESHYVLLTALIRHTWAMLQPHKSRVTQTFVSPNGTEK